MPTILVTGGAGYIGSHACKALAGAGFEPVTYDDLSGGYEQLVRWGPLERGDVLDAERLDDVIAHYQPLAVFHFAARISVAESIEDEAGYLRTNTQGSLILLDAMARAGIRHAVFSSTAAVYGEPREVPIPEAHLQLPLNPYGVSKQQAESAFTAWARDDHGSVMVFRYFNAAGADPDGETGECHDPETHLVPLALRAAANGTTFRLNGDDYPTRDGTCIRDFIHVTDLAEAHVQGLRSLLDGGPSRVLNLGTGDGHSVKEVLQTVESVTGHTLDVKIRKRRPGDAVELVADSTTAKQILDWAPRWSSLDKVIGTAWAWETRGNEQDQQKLARGKELRVRR